MDGTLRFDRPRVLRVRLGPGGLESSAFGSASLQGALARGGGSGLATALLSGARSATPPLVLAVGPAVVAGLPTAARVTVASRGPLHGRLAEGQVGSDLAARLARVCDALVVDGACEGYRLLLIEGDGSVRLEDASELVDRSPAELARDLDARFGPHASLRVGPAGRRRVAFSSLAAGGERSSFVGRGGLGAVLGATGLLALVVRAEPAHTLRAPVGLIDALARSPRLALRASQGTTELWHALSARGELRAGDGALDAERGARLSEAARAAGRERHGCRGCPTPCGWVFEQSSGDPQSARFGAVHAVGPALGLDRFDDGLVLLAACDRLGVDAKEAGAVLAVWCAARDAGRVRGDDPRGDLEALEATLVRLLDDPDAARGAVALAHSLELDSSQLPWLERSVRPGVAGAALLGQCVSSGGSDPMRSFPFLAEDAHPDRIAALTGWADPWPGELVWWHENLVAALDSSGFCAFSAAGLLADGVCSLDELAGWLDHASGADLIAHGARVVLARRELEARWGAPADRDRPAALGRELDRVGMLDAYRAARGIDSSGRPLPETLRAAAVRLAQPWRRIDARPAPPPPVGAPARATVQVHPRAVGRLAELLGPDPTVAVPPPGTASALLTALHAAHPLARDLLGPPERPLATLWRGGIRLASDEPLETGDRIDLVLAIAGG